MSAARRELPSGEVTLLFTDIEGSTTLLRELGAEGYEAALAEHRRALRTAFTEHGGVEVDTQGDSFFVAFPDATAAIRAAEAAQRALADGLVRVRMGLHTGAPRLTHEGYVGADVHLGARIAAAGHGGQVLVSKQTRDLLDEPLLDLGEHKLKDFGEPVWIYQLGADHFPPLRTISNTNLPRPASSFVGREREVADVRRLIEERSRLVTLTGPGGTGKTRLSIEAAAELLSEFKSGVFWVGVAALRDPALVVHAIAQTIGAKDGLADHIGQREMLLVLDNLEQVVEAAHDLATLLETCPNLQVLATSRERLRVRGEVEYAVPPLTEADAVDLFKQRSARAPDRTIAELCRRLDNLPLAVELAAARVSVLSPTQILERIAKRLDLLKGGRDSEDRQRTLRATIEWSYDLLSDEEKALFARLSAFSGGWTLEAAENVADANLDVLESLVDKSLVRHTDERFWMLETIREFAAERLDQLAEAESVRRRHAHFVIGFAEEAEPALFHEDTLGWDDRLEAEVDNIRAAIHWLLLTGDGEGAQRLAGALNEFWCTKNHLSEGRRLTESTLELGGPLHTRAKALLAAAHMARDTGDPETAVARSEEALGLYLQAGDEWRAAYARFWRGASLADSGEFARARQSFEEAARAFVELADVEYSLLSRRFIAWMHDALGDRKVARALHEENLSRIRALGYRQLEATTLGALASYAVDEGRVADARELSAAALSAYSRLGSLSGIANELCRCAGAFAIAGDGELATRLLSSALALHEEFGFSVLPHLEAENAATIARIREDLDESSFSEAWENGRRLSVDEAVSLALATENWRQQAPSAQ